MLSKRTDEQEWWCRRRKALPEGKQKAAPSSAPQPCRTDPSHTHWWLVVHQLSEINKSCPLQTTAQGSFCWNCPDCSGPKIKASLFLLLFLEARPLTRGQLFSCFCTNTLTCPSSAEFRVTSSRIWWTCKKCDTVWSFITVLKKCTLGEI